MKLSKTLPVLALAFALTAPIALLARAEANDALPKRPHRRPGDRPPSWCTACCPTAATPTGRARSTTRCRRKSTGATSSRSIPEKLFFTAQDIDEFAPYKTQLDDAIKSGELDPAVRDVRRLPRSASTSASRIARALLEQDLRLHGQRALRLRPRGGAVGGRHAPRSTRCGRRRCRNDWLRLKLAGKKPDEIRKTLDKRYANLRRPRRRAQRRGRVPDLHERVRERDRSAHRLLQPARGRELQPCRCRCRWKASARCCRSRTKSS